MRKPPFFAQHPVSFEEARRMECNRGHCYFVQDGDTGDAHVDYPRLLSGYHTFRLHGIDTPEITRPLNKYELEHGKAAKAFVQARILDRAVLLRSHKGTSFGRFEDELYYPRVPEDGPDVLTAFTLGGTEWVSLEQALRVNGFVRDLARYLLEMELKG